MIGLLLTSRLTRAQAIKKFCKQCSGSAQEARRCESCSCYLWRYRTGKEERDKFYKKSLRTSNFDEINRERNLSHINDKDFINTKS